MSREPKIKLDHVLSCEIIKVMPKLILVRLGIVTLGYILDEFIYETFVLDV